MFAMKFKSGVVGQGRPYWKIAHKLLFSLYNVSPGSSVFQASTLVHRLLGHHCHR